MERFIDKLPDPAISEIEKRLLGKPLPLELRRRVFEILDGPEEERDMVILGDDEARMRRMTKAIELLREHGYLLPEEEPADAAKQNESSGFSCFLLRIRQALHL